MSASIVVGTQWGDEGKGKIIDYLSKRVSWTVRFQGGANAGHTIVVGGERFALHLLPSGAVRDGVFCALAWGMVIDPGRLIDEIRAIEMRGIPLKTRLLIDGRATILLPQHSALDNMEETGRIGEGLGTTRRGIGPAYEGRAGRNVLLMADLLENDISRVRSVFDFANRRLERSGGEPFEWEVFRDRWRLWRGELGPLVGDCSFSVNEALDRGEDLLFEGAQGTHLDLYAGTFPYVTSSSTLAGAACSGCGVGPGRIERVIGVTKAYVTRVGTGPFPTEIAGEDAAQIQEIGKEKGTTTGRLRRCGWLDIPLLRASVLWNGLTEIALTKLDVLSGRKEIPVAVAYESDGRSVSTPPFSPAALGRVKPVYEMWPGWDVPGSLPGGALPERMLQFASRLGKEVGTPVTILSTGPEREATFPVGAGPESENLSRIDPDS